MVLVLRSAAGPAPSPRSAAECGENSAFRFCSCRCLFSNPPQNNVISTERRICRRSGETPVFTFVLAVAVVVLLNQPETYGCPIRSPPDRATVGERNPPAFAVAVASEIGPSSTPNVYAPIPTPQTIFRAFTQQNRMSSPQTPPKTNNSNLINKIKLSPKRFLVMVNPI
jgi:hypothetical protein